VAGGLSELFELLPPPGRLSLDPDMAAADQQAGDHSDDDQHAVDSGVLLFRIVEGGDQKQHKQESQDHENDLCRSAFFYRLRDCRGVIKPRVRFVKVRLGLNIGDNGGGFHRCRRSIVTGIFLDLAF